jgi:hypothetical protein
LGANITAPFKFNSSFYLSAIFFTSFALIFSNLPSIFYLKFLIKPRQARHSEASERKMRQFHHNFKTKEKR